MGKKQEPVIDGKHFFRALGYAMKACPSSEGQARFSHVAFVDHRIVCSDGERWHVGVLPLECKLSQPFIAARESVQELLLGLEYALKISKRHNQPFTVRMAADGGVTLSFGGGAPIEHKMVACDVGHVPDEWVEPVSPDAPALPTPPEMHCGAIKEAMQWYRSWDRDHGTCTFRGAGGNAPVRVDIVSGGDQVACAFLLPTTHAPAQLVHDEPLFESLNPGRRIGQSILDLQLDGDGTPASRPQVLVVDGKEFNIVGLDVEADDLVKRSPCIHAPKGTEPCAPCTSDAVRAARKEKKKRDKQIAQHGAAEEPTENETVQ